MNINDEQLCDWLINHASGAYRNSALGAHRIKELTSRNKELEAENAELDAEARLAALRTLWTEYRTAEQAWQRYAAAEALDKLLKETEQ